PYVLCANRRHRCRFAGDFREQSGSAGRKTWMEKVRTADQYSGWIPLRDVRRLEPGEPGYATSGRIAQVSSLTANLYRETDVTLHRPLLTIPFETRLEVVSQGQGEDADWFQVRLPDQRTGWVQSGDVD